MDEDEGDCENISVLEQYSAANVLQHLKFITALYNAYYSIVW